jgi:hypothetical protein
LINGIGPLDSSPLHLSGLFGGHYCFLSPFDMIEPEQEYELEAGIWKLEYGQGQGVPNACGIGAGAMGKEQATCEY